MNKEIMNGVKGKAKGSMLKAKVMKIAGYRSPLLQCNSSKSCFFNKIFAAKERKEHIDKSLCSLFFAIFAFFCGNSFLVAASAALGFLRFLAAIPLALILPTAGSKQSKDRSNQYV